MRQSQADALQAALVECQRFVRAAKKAIESKKEMAQWDDEGYFMEPADELGAAEWMARKPRINITLLPATKRASMDLTRALAWFRRA